MEFLLAQSHEYCIVLFVLYKEVLAGTFLSAWVLSLDMSLTGSCCHEFTTIKAQLPYLVTDT